MPNLGFVRNRFLNIWAKRTISHDDHALFDAVITFAQLVQETIDDPDLTDYARIEIMKDALGYK